MKYLECPKCKLKTPTTKDRDNIICAKCGFKGKPRFVIVDCITEAIK